LSEGEGIPTLIALLGDDSKSELIKCWQSNWGPAIETFKQSSPGEQAALVLASMGRTAFPALANQLTNSNTSVRRNAAWAIGELTNMAPAERSSAGPQLTALLHDSDVWVQMAAARALGEIRDRRAIESLMVTLSAPDWRVREMAAWALSEMKDRRAVQALGTVLVTDARAEVRRGAAEALGEIKSAEALPFLRQALTDPETRVSNKARWAINEIEDTE
jgi:HEAT repeat protein